MKVFLAYCILLFPASHTCCMSVRKTLHDPIKPSLNHRLDTSKELIPYLSRATYSGEGNIYTYLVCVDVRIRGGDGDKEFPGLTPPPNLPLYHTQSPPPPHLHHTFHQSPTPAGAGLSCDSLTSWTSSCSSSSRCREHSR